MAEGGTAQGAGRSRQTSKSVFDGAEVLNVGGTGGKGYLDVGGSKNPLGMAVSLTDASLAKIAGAIAQDRELVLSSSWPMRSEIRSRKTCVL